MKISLTNLKTENALVKKECLKIIEGLVRNPDFILGRAVNEFEKSFARFCGAKFCLGVASGTDALRTALLACDVNVGDEVITTPISYTATSLAIAHCGAKPVFVDVLEDGNIDPSKIEAAITKKTKAILIVHLYGNICKMTEIRSLANKFGLFLVDDCAHAHGAIYKGKKAGSLADISCFSFYPTKNLGAWGDAGAITTSSRDLYDKAALFKNYGEIEKNHSLIVGYNSRLDTLQAIVLNQKLKYLTRLNKKRSKIASRYAKKLVGVGDIVFPAFSPNFSYYLFTIRTRYRDGLRKFLAQKNIQTAIHYPLPIHLHECFKYLGYKKGDFPVSESHSQCVLSLPFGPFLLTKDQDSVVSSIRDFFATESA